MFFLEALSSALFGVFRYSGRSERLEQWTFTFFTAIIGVVIFAAVMNRVYIPPLAWVIILLMALWFLLAHIALFVRRLHDNDRSGSWMLLPFAALSIVFVGYLGQYGHVPFAEPFFTRYGWIITRVGFSACSISGSYLLWIFGNEGTRGANRYGEPPY